MRFGFSLGLMVGLTALVQANFTDAERDRVVGFWKAAGRYRVSAPEDADKKGPWQVRLTAEGSVWLWNYNKARGLGKVAPTADAGPQNDRQKAWETWIETQIAYDRWVAAVSAANANERALGRPMGEVPTPPAEPLPIPEDLVTLAGAPPAFAAAVAPMRHTIKFDDFEVSYSDQVPMRPRYAYFRFPQGVMFGGQSVRNMPPEEMDALFRDAGIDASGARVMKSISLLEGGFDSVNTYDTGYVSVGFIQFACLSGGSGSLGSVLLDLKTTNPSAFERDFRRFGVDVTDAAVLETVDPTSGAYRLGPDAAKSIIDDKRLIAVFQRAGAKCREFRLAQLRVAKSRYYPSEDEISIVGMNGPMFGKVGDFVKSEAGLATLMDRKVNTGTTNPLLAVATKVAQQRGVTSLPELAPFERDIIAALRYRKDYLADASLTQPPATTPPAVRTGGSVTSRQGKGRRGRGR